MIEQTKYYITSDRIDNLKREITKFLENFRKYQKHPKEIYKQIYMAKMLIENFDVVKEVK